MFNYLTDVSNVLVIGCGGAGLRSAIEAKFNGLDVKILGKRSRFDSHTVLAAGGINAAFGNLDKNDSWEQHFVDTYLEGYKLGNPEIIEYMTKNSPDLVKEIDSWGANLEKLENGKFDQRFFGAHTYRRTCYSGDFTGQTILKACLRKAEDLEIPIFDSQYVFELLVKDKKCFGAISFNIHSGEKTVHYADAVILCTGGHTRIWKKSSSRKQENNGDGFYLALKAGCSLIDMEMVQFHPTGMISPKEIEGKLVTEAVRGEGGILRNVHGERFMKKYDLERMELSTRDIIAKANYNEIVNGNSTENGGVFLDISHKDKDFIIRKLPRIYRQFLEFQSLDISKEPMEVAPTAHYSMGGIKVSPLDHKTCVEGLFAAGEVAGGLHGANRLGGNSLAEILVYGKLAGLCASNYSKKLNFQLRDQMTVQKLNNEFEDLIKSGEHLAIPLQNELSDLMWKYCGVVKNEEKLLEGLTTLGKLKEKSKFVDVRVSDNNFQDLVNLFDLKASLFSAEATLLSALQRKESRGAHQRSDYLSLDEKEKYNLEVKKVGKNFEIYKNGSVKLNKKLNKLVSKSKNILNFKNKLLE